MWRCFQHLPESFNLLRVCSTHVEMFLSFAPTSRRLPRLLHACGDVSMIRNVQADAEEFAPRMWRCFPIITLRIALSSVCSTHVEMFLRRVHHVQGHGGLLHACGDVSFSRFKHGILQGFAPRMWRCFLHVEGEIGKADVCSTHVENFSIIIYHKSHLIAPRCGDVSCCISASFSSALSAPRMWRFYLSP